MKSHYLVKSKQGPLPSTTIDLCIEVMKQSLPYPTQECFVTTSVDGRTAFFSASNEGITPASLLQHASTHDWTFGLTGREPDGVVPDSLFNSATLRPTALNSFVNETAGQFSLLGMNRQSGECFGTVALCRAQPMYIAESESLIVVGSSCLTAHLVAIGSTTPKYDLDSIPLFLMNGYFVSDDTAFVDCKAVPSGSTVVVRPNGAVQIESIDIVGLYEGQRALTPQQIEERLNEFSDAFQDYFAALAPHVDRLLLPLTGGKDSRTIFGGLLTLGKPINTRTNDRGPNSTLDLQIAKQIAAHFADSHGVIHEVRYELEQEAPEGSQTLTKAEADLYLQLVLRYSDANLTLREWLPLVEKDFAPHFQGFSGAGGEQLRGGFSVSNPLPREKFRNHFAAAKLPWTAAVVDAAKPSINAWFARFPNLNDVELRDLHHLQFRMGRWASAAQYCSAMTGYPSAPYFDNRVIWKMLGVPPETRSNDLANYHFLKRISPALVEFPFSDDKWRFEFGTDPESQQRLAEQLRNKFTSSVAPLYELGARSRFFESNVPHFEQRLLEGTLSNLLDHDGVKQLLYPRHGRPLVAVVYNLMTGDMLLRDDWWQQAA